MGGLLSTGPTPPSLFIAADKILINHWVTLIRKKLLLLKSSSQTNASQDALSKKNIVTKKNCH